MKDKTEVFTADNPVTNLYSCCSHMGEHVGASTKDPVNVIARKICFKGNVEMSVLFRTRITQTDTYTHNLRRFKWPGHKCFQSEMIEVFESLSADR